MADNAPAAGAGRILIAVYVVLALAATVRSGYQIATKFEVAPIAYLLSGVAGLVYILATIALVRKGRAWYRVAWATITFELIGVLAVGTISLIDDELFPADTVWSGYGSGYVFIPLLMPILGMLWLYSRRPSRPTPIHTGD